MKVLIAGGGVGGLTLALILKRRGIDAEVFEQASEIRELGVGINTLPHAIRELAALDLLPALDRVAIRTKELVYMNRFGQDIWREPRGVDAGFEVPQFSIHRGRLQSVIHRAVAAELGRNAVGCELNLEYIGLAEKRIKEARDTVPLFDGV
jgi:2-polyprenyl-6-methoxyphenol hydroxylase-like FAD-dependent oxidoreductase